MEGVETDGWVTEMVRYVICPDEDIWYIWSDNARQRMTLILNVLSCVFTDKTANREFIRPD